ncbi:MAG: efflux RND transporter permease subunit [Candidatus Krumholzibacteria bacterium]|nr:efflux RND transporter permease subunit [Candidatus Krumholzibacteria bacterium]
MRIVDFSIKRPVTVTMIFVATVVFGFVALSRLQLRLLPEISYPSLTIQTDYPDAAPAEVENFVTRPLEEAVGVISGLRSVRSVSKPGMSEIILEFTWKTSMQYAALDVRDKIDLVRLPRECKAPVILRYDPSLDPVIRMGVSGSDNLVRLRNLADYSIKKELEALDGVASAKVLGGLEEEIQVELDERRLSSYGIPIATVAARLAQDNVNQSGGRLRDKGSEFLLRTENEFKSVDDIANTIVREDAGRRVILADLGSVTRGHVEREVITRLNGREVVEIAVYKEGDANTVTVADAIKRRVDMMRHQLPDDVKIDVLFDQSRFIKSAINEVRLNAIQGALLSVLILYIFLRDFRSTMIIGLSIPISIMFTFVIMQQLGVSLNLMSLGGLALGVGMLVDNSIVVLESISRHKETSPDRKQATGRGASEVASAVTGATLTTVAVFLPIIFVEGLAGQVFKDQALTVSISLLASLVVSLMLIPMASSLEFKARPLAGAPAGAAKPLPRRRIGRWMRAVTGVLVITVPVFVLKMVRIVSGWLVRGLTFISRPLRGAYGRFYPRLETSYTAALDRALAHRGLFLTGMLTLFGAAILVSPFIGKEVIPQFSQGEFSFAVQMPEGTPLENTDARLARMEEFVDAEPGVESYFTSVGTATRLGSNIKNKDENLGQLNVVMENKGDPVAEERLVNSLRAKFAGIAGADINFARPSYFTFQTPLEVHVFGYDLDELKQFSDELVLRVAEIPGVKDVKSSLEFGNPELDVQFDRVRMSSMGLAVEEVANTVRTKIAGDVPTQFKERDKQIDIRVRTSAWRAQDIDAMRSLVVAERDGTPILLGTIADVEVARGVNQISRVSQQRAAVVSGNVSGRDLGNVADEVTAMLASLSIPQGITVELGGENEELQRSYRSLILALILAVFLVYLVMAAQFESFVHPFIIMFTVPLAAIGVVFTLLITGKPLSVVVFIGVILLAGIVVNNGIVLIDYINTLRREGSPKVDAVRAACRVRLRPILMTTLTTVLGLMPMALGFGEGAEIRAPMALSVIGGLAVGSILTLFVIPSLYSVVARGD